MQYKVIDAPDVEPISLSEAKTYLKVDHNDEDTLIATLIKAAREYIESHIGRAMITQTIEAVYDDWCIILPLANAQSVTSVKYYDNNGNQQTWDAANYTLEAKGEPNSIVRNVDVTYPVLSLPKRDRVEVIYVAGFGDDADSVPAELKIMMYKVLSEFYEHREDRPWEKLTASRYMIRKNAQWLF